MCHVCELEGKKLAPGQKMFERPLHSVFSNNRAYIRLCYIHDIELFVSGEKKFLRNHLELAKDLSLNPKKYIK